jgi:hypothetical protein
MSVSFDRKAKGTSETEIGELNYSIFVNKEVLGFQVTVHNSVGVAISRALEDLVGEALHFLRGKGSSHMAHVLFEIELAILEDQVEFVF